VFLSTHTRAVVDIKRRAELNILQRVITRCTIDSRYY